MNNKKYENVNNKKIGITIKVLPIFIIRRIF